MISPAVKKDIQDYLKGILPVLILLALCSIGAGIAASQFISDSVIVEVIFVGTVVLLLFWWGFISWRQKSDWVMKLQDMMSTNQMLSFTFTKIKSNMPWNVDHNRDRLMRAAAAEYQNLRDRAKETQQTLEKYVGSNVSSKATDKAGRSELGGESRRVYVLFSDVRSFTRMAEQLQPQETVEILNKMFTAMEEVITQNGGDINKYIGDAIFAYFRRPYSNEGEAAKLVLRTALRMQDRFALLNQAFKVSYSQPVEIGLGIGVTAGTAIVGNLGSANRMEFTLIGDTVNLASRLCGIAKHGQILVNEEMAEVSQDFFEMTALPAVQIKGKSGMHIPYEVVGERLTMGR
jgi:class 3 adenylate cyclase